MGCEHVYRFGSGWESYPLRWPGVRLNHFNPWRAQFVIERRLVHASGLLNLA